MLGLISPDVNAVSLEVTDEGLVVHFAVEADTEAIREDVEDMLGDLDALLYNESDLFPQSWTIQHQIYVGRVGQHWPGRWHRRVFEMKRPPG